MQNVAIAAMSIIMASTPTVLGHLPMWIAVLLHEGSTLFVAANSLRALRNVEPVTSRPPSSLDHVRITPTHIESPQPSLGFQAQTTG